MWVVIESVGTVTTNWPNVSSLILINECETLAGKLKCYNRPNFKSGTRTPPREYNAWWSQEKLSVYRLDDKDK
jgi:hypothetical protein